MILLGTRAGVVVGGVKRCVRWSSSTVGDSPTQSGELSCFAQQQQEIKLEGGSTGLESQGEKVEVAEEANSHREVRYADLDSLPRVASTNNIQESVLFYDTMLNQHMPLLSPVKKNHMSRKRKQVSILQNLEEYKRLVKDQKLGIKVPDYSIFCNSALDTQQHNIKMFNLPKSYLSKLSPFVVANKPGEELYRDDLIVLTKIESELVEQEKLAKLKHKLEKEGKIWDIEEFFGFK